MSERRKFRRFSVDRRCWCEGENITIFAQMGNLSEGGAFVRTYAPLATGSKARVRFSLEGGREIRVEAVVVWRRDGSGVGTAPGMGIRFDQADIAARESLRSWVESVDGDGLEES